MGLEADLEKNDRLSQFAGLKRNTPQVKSVFAKWLNDVEALRAISPVEDHAELDALKATLVADMKTLAG